MPGPGEASPGRWKRLGRHGSWLLSWGPVLLLAPLVFSQFLSLHLKEKELDRRERTLLRISADLHGLVQATEQLAARIEQDLHRQQETVTSMEANLQQTSHLSADVPLPIELPLEQAPSP